jgi:hypothetical protein
VTRMPATITDLTRKALGDCLAFCGISPFPTVALAEFLMVLRLTGRWTSEQLVALRSETVRRLADGYGKRSTVL